MFRYHIRTAIRNLIRFRLVSVMNILALSVGMSISVLLFLFVRLELSFDGFHKDADKIFRIISNISSPDGQLIRIPSTLAATGPAINKLFQPQVTTCRIYNNQMGRKYTERRSDHVDFYYADSTFFKVFNFGLLKGNPDSVLTRPFTVVLSRKMAETYFKEDDPVGKLFEIHNNYFTVTGVHENVPFNSDLQFDLLLSFSTFNRDNRTSRMSMDFPTYMKITDDPGPGAGGQKLTYAIDSVVNDHFRTSSIEVYCNLQALKDIHLNSSDLFYTLSNPGDMDHIIILLSLGIFILIITVSNFVSLITTRTEYSLREMGMRLVLGAEKKDILRQVVEESVFLALIAAIVACALVELFSVPLSVFTGFELDYRFATLISVFVFFCIVIILTGSLTGLIQYYHLYRFSPVEVLTILRRGGRVNRIKITLVVVQFILVIFLISGLSVMLMQVNFMKKKDPGFDMENLLVYYNQFSYLSEDFEPVRKELMGSRYIKNASATASIPGEISSIQNFWHEGQTTNDTNLITENRAGNHYLNTYAFLLAAGREFDDYSPVDTTGFILNEAAVKAFRIKDPVGKVININVHRDTVIGVVKDFHYRSLRDPIEPLVITRYFRPYRFITLRTNADSIYKVTEYADSILKKYYPRGNFVNYSLRSRFSIMYNEEVYSTKLVLWVTILVMLISVMGLFGLSAHTVIRRTKEIGIRKANGGTSIDIMLMLAMEILKWILIAMAIALPLASIAAERWLDNYSYRITGNWWILLSAGILTMLVAVATVSYHAVSIGRKNPVDSLRYE
jgi:putative ABC transport system permease protein